MGNPFRRRRTQLPPPPRKRPSWRDQRERDEAAKALDRAIDNWPDVRAAVSDIRDLRERNHLAEKIHRALGGADA